MVFCVKRAKTMYLYKSAYNAVAKDLLILCDFGQSGTKVGNRERNMVKSLVNPKQCPRLHCDTRPPTNDLEGQKKA